jgi:hypothetical protein
MAMGIRNQAQVILQDEVQSMRILQVFDSRLPYDLLFRQQVAIKYIS